MTPLAFNLLSIVTTFAMLLIFIRFMLQFAGISSRNPYVEPAYKTTKIVDLFESIFPTIGQGRISLAAIALMFLIRLVDLSATAGLAGHGFTPLELFFSGSLSLILDFLAMCRYLIMGSIILSWVVMFTNSMHPMIEIIMQLAEPILAPFRRLIPNIGMLDLSPIIAFFALALAERLVRSIAVMIAPMLGG
ncbi:YggT family protein [Psychrobacter sp. HD31]|uniref:YggT family protein n=1 Tax=Psychrobacter sp. HD31 TaxID=3112003 RepID=UPI003DA5CE3E